MEGPGDAGPGAVWPPPDEENSSQNFFENFIDGVVSAVQIPIDMTNQFHKSQMQCIGMGEEDQSHMPPYLRRQRLTSKLDLSFAKTMVTADRMVAELALRSDRVEAFKEALQTELSRQEPMSPLSRTLTADRSAITHENTLVEQVYRETESSLSWEDILQRFEGDLIFIYVRVDERLVLVFNHGVLDGMTAVEALVRINGCHNIKSMSDMPSISNNPITVGKAILQYTQRLTQVTKAARLSPILDWWKVCLWATTLDPSHPPSLSLPHPICGLLTTPRPSRVLCVGGQEREGHHILPRGQGGKIRARGVVLGDDG